jgi:predicted ester cyclase
MSTSQNKDTVRRFYNEVITSQDGQAVREVIAPDITVHDPIMGELHGIDAFHQLIGVFQLGFPQQSATVEALVAEDDLVSALHTHQALNSGSFMGMPPTGREVRIRGLELFRIRDGKIVELWRHDDDAGLMRQLGLIPAPAGEAVSR